MDTALLAEMARATEEEAATQALLAEMAQATLDEAATQALLAEAARATEQQAASQAVPAEAPRQQASDRKPPIAEGFRYKLWQGYLERLAGTSKSGLLFTYIKGSTKEGVTGRFWMDQRCGAGDQWAPSWIQRLCTWTLAADDFKFAAMQNLPVTFWGMAEAVPGDKFYRKARMTQNHQMMLMAAAGRASQAAWIAAHNLDRGHGSGWPALRPLPQQPQQSRPMDLVISELEEHHATRGGTAVPHALAAALQPLVGTLQQLLQGQQKQNQSFARLHAGQRRLQGASDATSRTAATIQAELTSLAACVNQWMKLTHELKAAAAIGYREHVQAQPEADESRLPCLFEQDATDVGPLSRRQEARQQCINRIKQGCIANTGTDWEQYDATAPQQGQYTVYGREKGVVGERPYNCPTPEQKLRRTVSMYKAMRSRFGGRPLGRATTAEVRTAIAEGALGDGWRAMCGFGPNTEVNVSAPHLERAPATLKCA